jgi:hypothetical protein
MTAFLAGIGQKLADRWVALLVLPGLVYLAAATAAAVLGQRSAVDFPALSDQVANWAALVGTRSTGAAVLLTAGILAGSALAGYIAETGGQLTEILWTAPGRRGPARWLARRRRKRSRAAKAVADQAFAPQAEVLAAMREANRICIIEADRPTWIGDRLRACYVRVDKTYGLDLDAAWPRLWLILPEPARSEIAAARDSFSSAARVTAWGIMYLLLAIWWWPASLVALAAMAAGTAKARAATANLTNLVEAAVDLYAHELAIQLGEQLSRPLPSDVGRRLTVLMRKSRWEPGSPLAD